MRNMRLQSRCLELVRRWPIPLAYTVACVALRAWSFWLIVRTTQCAYPGVEAFLPFFIVVWDAFGCSAFRFLSPKLPETAKVHSLHFVSNPRTAYGFVALLWGFSAVSALPYFRTITGTICPAGWEWKPLVVGAQVAICIFDAVVLVSMSDLRRAELENAGDPGGFLIIVPLTAAFCIFGTSFWTLLSDSDLFWAFCPSIFDLKDLAIDSLATTVVVVCGFSLAQVLHPTTIGLLVSSLGLFGGYIFQPIAGLLLPPTYARETLGAAFVVAALLGVLCCFTLKYSDFRQRHITSIMHRWLLLLLVAVCMSSVVIVSWSNDVHSVKSVRQAITELVAAGDAKAQRWATGAVMSRTLEEAVAEYRHRYGSPPPPNFDAWYNFATARDSPVIDDFDQVHQDLLPFWGIDPAEIRHRTSDLLSYPILEMGGLRIRNGTVEISPHVPASHRWMMDSLERMISPFSQWLPDMDLAINLADECRMAVPFGEMEAMKVKGRNLRSNIVQDVNNETKDGRDEFRWPETFTDPAPRDKMPAEFAHYGLWQLYYDLIAPSCSPTKLARHKRWWDRSTMCVECIAPHSTFTEHGLLLADNELAHDMCHQPDMAYLDGFIMSPSRAMVGTQSLFPIFSQGRIGGFSDILIPSPWNFDHKCAYDEKLDMAWGEKEDGLFWRGSSSDGYAAHGSWTGFLRARFVHEAYEQKQQERTINKLPSINVSFAGDVHKCLESDCATELESFQTWADAMQINTTQRNAKQGSTEKTASSLLSQAVPFGENWRFRHLFDMDGAGFSGRLLPFLESRSLIYRAAIFQTWFGERLSAWHHYVPVDARLGSGLWAVLAHFFENTEGSNNDMGGDRTGQKIAEQGRQWTKKALRDEDMQIYMFRKKLYSPYGPLFKAKDSSNVAGLAMATESLAFAPHVLQGGANMPSMAVKGRQRGFGGQPESP
ncbi:hypothetical protein G7046_g4501 [Stylonectria norvegica]|nr:hypothetical protein G7046_g4501 [Stylonectria norvegica]